MWNIFKKNKKAGQDKADKALEVEKTQNSVTQNLENDKFEDEDIVVHAMSQAQEKIEAKEVETELSTFELVDSHSTESDLSTEKKEFQKEEIKPSHLADNTYNNGEYDFVKNEEDFYSQYTIRSIENSDNQKTKESEITAEYSPSPEDANSKHTAKIEDSFNEETKLTVYADNDSNATSATDKDDMVNFQIVEEESSENTTEAPIQKTKSKRPSSTSGKYAQENTSDNKTKEKEQKSKGKEKAPIESGIACSIEVAGFAQKSFNLFSHAGLLVLIIFATLLCAQQNIFLRDFWVLGEVQLADAYRNLLATDMWWQTLVNGQAYAEISPFYVLSLKALSYIPILNIEQIFFFSASLTTILFTASIWLLARGIGYSKEVAFASGLITLCLLASLGFSFIISASLLTMAAINISLLCFYRAWKKSFAPLWLLAAFSFTAIAMLLGGIFGFIMPLLASAIFLLWSGRLKRFNSLDGLFGFLLCLAIVFAWFTFLFLYNYTDFLHLYIEEQIVKELSPFGMRKYADWIYLVMLIVFLFPFCFLLFFTNWFQTAKNFVEAFRQRKTCVNSTWIVCAVTISTLIFGLASEKDIFGFIPFLALFSILCAQAVLNLSFIRSRLFFGLTALCFILFGLTFIAFEFYALYSKFLPDNNILEKYIPECLFTLTQQGYHGFALTGTLLFIVGAFQIAFTRRKLAGGSLLVLCLSFILATQAFSFALAPTMSEFLSPRKQASLLADYQTKGYTPLSYQTSAANYVYYYNQALNNTHYEAKTITELTTNEELRAFLREHKKVIATVPLKALEDLPYHTESQSIQQQWLLNKHVSVIIWDISELNEISEINEAQQDTLEIEQDALNVDADKTNDVLKTDTIVPNEISTLNGTTTDSQQDDAQNISPSENISKEDTKGNAVSEDIKTPSLETNNSTVTEKELNTLNTQEEN